LITKALAQSPGDTPHLSNEMNQAKVGAFHLREARVRSDFVIGYQSGMFTEIAKAH
jgi:hypothetical protein